MASVKRKANKILIGNAGRERQTFFIMYNFVYLCVVFRSVCTRTLLRISGAQFNFFLVVSNARVGPDSVLPTGVFCATYV